VWRFTSKGKRKNTVYSEDDVELRNWKNIKRNNYDEGNRIENGSKSKNINTMTNGVMENGRKDKGKKAYGDGQEWTRHLECGFSKISEEGCHLKNSHSRKIRPKLGEHKSHTICVEFSFYIKIQHKNTWSKTPYL